MKAVFLHRELAPASNIARVSPSPRIRHPSCSRWSINRDQVFFPVSVASTLGWVRTNSA